MRTLCKVLCVAIAVSVTLATAAYAAPITLIDPVTNNGSFESPAGSIWRAGVIPDGWTIPGADADNEGLAISPVSDGVATLALLDPLTLTTTNPVEASSTIGEIYNLSYDVYTYADKHSTYQASLIIGDAEYALTAHVASPTVSGYQTYTDTLTATAVGSVKLKIACFDVDQWSYVDNVRLTGTVPVPEAGSLILLATGLLGLLAYAWRKRK